MVTPIVLAELQPMDPLKSPRCPAAIPPMTSQTISSSDPMCIMASIASSAKWNETASREKAYPRRAAISPIPLLFQESGSRSAAGEDASRLVDRGAAEDGGQDADIGDQLGVRLQRVLLQDDE